MIKPKKALLDTDILFKTQLAQNVNREALAELVIHFEGYEFFCHEKILHELSYHGFDPDPVPWLRDKIEKGIVKCYSDEDIINEIKDEYGVGATRYYLDMLRISCDSFELDFFDTAYKPLIELSDCVDESVFLNVLENCDCAIENGSSMGEKKSFVLAQLLQLKYPGQVVVFCSDDSRARRNVTYIDGSIRCLSILATFQKLKADGLAKDAARQYFDSLCSFYALHNQKSMKVWKHGTSERISVEFERLFDEIYAGKFEIRASGDLRYKE